MRYGRWKIPSVGYLAGAGSGHKLTDLSVQSFIEGSPKL